MGWKVETVEYNGEKVVAHVKYSGKDAKRLQGVGLATLYEEKPVHTLKIGGKEYRIIKKELQVNSAGDTFLCNVEPLKVKVKVKKDDQEND